MNKLFLLKIVRTSVVQVGLVAAAILLFVPDEHMVLAQEAPVTVQSADEATVDAALDFIRNGQIDRGVFILQRLAGQGNADSLFHMGELFRLGVGRSKANDVATMYYRLAAALGHKTASLSLANMLFFEGDGSDKTLGEALSVWQTLALEGDVESIYMLGMLYWNGDAGLAQDPVRGYGLVWRAAQSGYADAVQNELTMHSLLNAEARQAAEEYGKSISEAGFGGEPLALDLLVAQAPAVDETPPETPLTIETEQPAKVLEKEPVAEPAIEPITEPDDWSTVWRLEVGFAMSEVNVRRLQSMISQTQADIVGKLFSDVAPSASRPGLFKLTYGPMKSLQDAVTTCVTLKRAGHDCAAKAPEE